MKNDKIYSCKVKTLYSVIEKALSILSDSKKSDKELNEIKNILIWPIIKHCDMEIKKSCEKWCKRITKIYKKEAEILKYHAQSEIREHLTIIILNTDTVINKECKLEEREKVLEDTKKAAFYISDKLDWYFKTPDVKNICNSECKSLHI